MFNSCKKLLFTTTTYWNALTKWFVASIKLNFSSIWRKRLFYIEANKFFTTLFLTNCLPQQNPIFTNRNLTKNPQLWSETESSSRNLKHHLFCSNSISNRFKSLYQFLRECDRLRPIIEMLFVFANKWIHILWIWQDLMIITIIIANAIKIFMFFFVKKQAR